MSSNVIGGLVIWFVIGLPLALCVYWSLRQPEYVSEADNAVIHEAECIVADAYLELSASGSLDNPLEDL